MKKVVRDSERLGLNQDQSEGDHEQYDTRRSQSEKELRLLRANFQNQLLNNTFDYSVGVEKKRKIKSQLLRDLSHKTKKEEADLNSRTVFPKNVNMKKKRNPSNPVIASGKPRKARKSRKSEVKKKKKKRFVLVDPSEINQLRANEDYIEPKVPRLNINYESGSNQNNLIQSKFSKQRKTQKSLKNGKYQNCQYIDEYYKEDGQGEMIKIHRQELHPRLRKNKQDDSHGQNEKKRK